MSQSDEKRNTGSSVSPARRSISSQISAMGTKLGRALSRESDRTATASTLGEQGELVVHLIDNGGHCVAACGSGAEDKQEIRGIQTVPHLIWLGEADLFDWP